MRGWAGEPLLGTMAARRWAMSLLGAGLVLVVTIAPLVARETTADDFDRAVDARIIASLGGYHGLLGWLAFPGTPLCAAAVTLVIVVECLHARRLNGAILAVAAVPVSTGLGEELVKPFVHRTYLGTFAFPSGHTTTTMALTATVAVLYVAGPARRRVWRAAALSAALAVTCVVSLAVIALHWHYFTDTIAGAAVGAGTVCALALVLDLRPVRRLLVPPSVAADVRAGARARS
jgi:membrane-associated phospholipid phosphatase